MKKMILTDRAIQDFSDLEKEINTLMSVFLNRSFEMRKESTYSKYKKMSYMLYILFCNEHMHRYEITQSFKSRLCTTKQRPN